MLHLLNRPGIRLGLRSACLGARNCGEAAATSSSSRRRDEIARHAARKPLAKRTE